MAQSRTLRLLGWGTMVVLLALAAYLRTEIHSPAMVTPRTNASPPRPPTDHAPTVAEPPAVEPSRIPARPYDPSALPDPETALVYFRTLRSQEMSRVLERLVYDEDKLDPKVKRMLIEALFQVWTENDLPRALAAVAEHDTARWALVAGWARLDPLAVWQWAEAANRSETSSELQSIIRISVKAGRGDVVADLLIERLQARPTDGVAGLGLLATELAAKDPAQALQWVRRIEAINPVLAPLMVGSLGPQFAQLSGLELTAFINTQSVAVGDAMIGAVAYAWMEQNQLNRLNQFVAENTNLSATRQDIIYANIGTTLVREDPDLALQILGRLNDPAVRDQRISGAASALQGDGPIKSGKAMDFILTIANEPRRITLLKEAYAIFEERYPEEARDFISRDGFPSQYRSVLQIAVKP